MTKKNTSSKWLNLSRTISAELRPKILSVAGTPKAAEIVNQKGAGGDETTYIDALAEKIFAKHLKEFKKSGEKFSLLSEEVGHMSYGAPYPLIVVDPIDGSINCKRGLPFYAVSIGVYNGPAVGSGFFGYVINLANGDEFHAESGSRKSYMNGKLINFDPVRSKTPNLLVVEFPLKEEVLKRAAPMMMAANRTRVMGSLALGMVYTACGASDMFMHLKPSRVIDYAGAKIIFEEAGGIVSDEYGKSLDSLTIDLKRKAMLIAARGKPMLDAAVKSLTGK